MVVANIPESLRMLLYRRWIAALKGNIQCDLSYATISIAPNKFVKLHQERRMLFKADVPNRELEGMLCCEIDLGMYAMMSKELGVTAQALIDLSP